MIHLDSNFKMHLLEGKTIQKKIIFTVKHIHTRGTQQSFGLPCSTPDKHSVDIAFLDHYATTQWEAILHYMVGTSLTKKPSRGVLNLLERSKLMQNK